MLGVRSNGFSGVGLLVGGACFRRASGSKVGRGVVSEGRAAWDLRRLAGVAECLTGYGNRRELCCFFPTDDCENLVGATAKRR